MNRVRNLRLSVAAAVAVALTAAVGTALLRSSVEKAGDRSTAQTREAPETYGKGTFAPTGAVTVCPRYGAIITRRSKDHPFSIARPKSRVQNSALESFSRGLCSLGRA
jgi:hypothetical protein